jgi:hypothetical protein
LKEDTLVHWGHVKNFFTLDIKTLDQFNKLIEAGEVRCPCVFAEGYAACAPDAATPHSRGVFSACLAQGPQDNTRVTTPTISCLLCTLMLILAEPVLTLPYTCTAAVQSTMRGQWSMVVIFHASSWWWQAVSTCLSSLLTCMHTVLPACGELGGEQDVRVFHFDQLHMYDDDEKVPENDPRKEWTVSIPFAGGGAVSSRKQALHPYYH